MNVKVLGSLAFLSITCYLFFPYYRPHFDIFTNNSELRGAPPVQSTKCDPDIAPFYIYELPDRFSEVLHHNCSSINPWKNMCPYFENNGMGQPFNKTNWYNTYQFSADMLFHGRAVNHPCRTYDPSVAAIFYIPFHTSLYVHVFSNEKNMTKRAALWFDLLDHMSSLPTFQRHGGHDHFLVSGVMVWNFIVPPYKEGEPARLNDFLKFPELSNVSALIIERNTYSKNQIGIPYPSYFHPQSDAEIRSWQDEVSLSERTHLFAFVGGARHKDHGAANYRSAVISQCNSTESCLLITCNFWGAVWDAVDDILGALKRAHFCLQPPGDTWTRRAVFDAILTGCIPVFFTDLTAYQQYEWYIPERREDWSVLIGPDELYQIEEVLSKIPEEEVERMRKIVIGMIPQVTYGHPNATWTEVGFRDAVDTALVKLTKYTQQIKDGSHAFPAH
jgi:xyloglucan galactosyltransferase MUR3